ncbi:hypothetical protein BDY17DRAFT_183864 [Neohortaea acidophila]|uniref:Uncharacterized protein n=1 Tax=Neohortaea acidophila TaxID=245834 RepID=A0A6A6PPI3_9PEZI|nr:uncharacterized protein BDY17DRAFT_183864 [Neohortaea acidophila]KAF2481167.1 hypothetical protein BDY17DRAFT_183864 [Neohortaea acidophila]
MVGQSSSACMTEMLCKPDQHERHLLRLSSLHNQAGNVPSALLGGVDHRLSFMSGQKLASMHPYRTPPRMQQPTYSQHHIGNASPFRHLPDARRRCKAKATPDLMLDSEYCIQRLR